MSRSLGIVCAAVLLCASAGCTLDSFFLSFSGSSNRKEDTVALSVNQVSSSLQAMIHDHFGITLVSSTDGEELHLKGQTRQGKSFQFILQRQRSNDGGERTIVAFEGEKEAEFLLWDAAIGAVKNGSQQPKPQTPVTVVPQGNPNPAAPTYDRVRGGVQ